MAAKGGPPASPIHSTISCSTPVIRRRAIRSAFTGSDAVAIIEATNICKSFGETKALAGVSFEARPGEIHAIVGENGSGKSTLAKVFSGVHRPDSGRLIVCGGVPATPVEALGLGVATIFQEVLVAGNATVTENIFIGTDGTWWPSMSMREKRQSASDMLLRYTGQRIDPDERVGNLPLSIKQWIVIARAIVRKPRVLILDESSAALDFEASERLHGEMRRLVADGVCVLIVTHRIAELVKLADRATVLRDGRDVGRLEKSAITEKNLIAMMSSQSRIEPSEGLASRAIRSHRTAPLLSAEITVCPAARRTDFSIGEGEIVGITGLEGHGHDYFLRILAGIEKASAGAPYIHGHGQQPAPIRSICDAGRLNVAYVSGDRKRDGIFPNLSILENFAAGLYSREAKGWLGWIDRAAIRWHFDAEAKRLSIRLGSPSNVITSLSGGNQQKVLIGRAHAVGPRLILLNDPARGVDLATKRDLYETLRRFAAKGGGVVYLSSEIEEFIGFADRVVVFRHAAPFAFFGTDDIGEHQILRAMFGHQSTFADADMSAVARGS